MIVNKLARSQRKIFFISLILIVFLLVITVFYKKTVNCGVVSCLTFPEKNFWKLSEVYESTNKSWRGEFKHPDYLVRVQKVAEVNEDDAAVLSRVKFMEVEGLFEKARSPYPGEISDEIVCPDDLKPVKGDLVSSKGVKIQFMTSFLNERLQYGTCVEDQIAKKAYVGDFYCSNTREWYQVEIIVPIEKSTKDQQYKELFLDAGCQRPSLNTGRLFP